MFKNFKKCLVIDIKKPLTGEKTQSMIKTVFDKKWLMVDGPQSGQIDFAFSILEVQDFSEPII